MINSYTTIIRQRQTFWTENSNENHFHLCFENTTETGIFCNFKTLRLSDLSTTDTYRRYYIHKLFQLHHFDDLSVVSDTPIVRYDANLKVFE